MSASEGKDGQSIELPPQFAKEGEGAKLNTPADVARELANVYRTAKRHMHDADLYLKLAHILSCITKALQDQSQQEALEACSNEALMAEVRRRRGLSVVNGTAKRG